MTIIEITADATIDSICYDVLVNLGNDSKNVVARHLKTCLDIDKLLHC